MLMPMIPARDPQPKTHPCQAHETCPCQELSVAALLAAVSSVLSEFRNPTETCSVACSLGLSATNHQYFSLRTNQPAATSQQYSSLRTNQHQPSATSQPNRLDATATDKPGKLEFDEQWIPNFANVATGVYSSKSQRQN
jgi:hypothetical protein